MNTTGIDLYSWATPNGWKASCTLEELAIPYTVYPVDIMKGQQRVPEYLALNPNAKIPTIVDHDVGHFSVFESGAIVIYLAEKAGRLLPAEFKAAAWDRCRVRQTCFFATFPSGCRLPSRAIRSRSEDCMASSTGVWRT